MLSVILNSKRSNYKGYYFEKKIPIDITSENYLDNAVPFKFEFINETENEEFLVFDLRTRGRTVTIATYKDIKFEIGDRVAFDGLIFDVEESWLSFTNSKKNKLIKQTYVRLK